MQILPVVHQLDPAMRLSLALFLTLVITLPTLAHPGMGIVRDSRGNVFYTDLTHVWKIRPDGRKSIAVRNVHTHELYLDAQDNLYGEHLWYEHGRDRWSHRVWCLRANGQLVDVIPSREGFLYNYHDFSFVRDAAGNLYFRDSPGNDRVRKRLSNGQVVLATPTRFSNLRSMTTAPDGTLYLLDGPDLKRLDPNGQVHTLARNLREQVAALSFAGDAHNLMGLWLDRLHNVYVAVYGGAMVKKITPNGMVSVVARTSLPWSPTGGLVAPNGDLWLLEYSLTNAARVRCISTNGTEQVY
jgi:hypothetical protein